MRTLEVGVGVEDVDLEMSTLWLDFGMCAFTELALVFRNTGCGISEMRSSTSQQEDVDPVKRKLGMGYGIRATHQPTNDWDLEFRNYVHG